MEKLFDHWNVGIYTKYFCEIGIIKTTVFEDEYYTPGNLEPRVHKTVEFIYGKTTIYKFVYDSQFDTATDEAVKYWTNELKRSKLGLPKMIRYFIKDEDIPLDPHNIMRKVITYYENEMADDSDK